MTTPARGRPRASSRETIADAATELFLEQGYESTAVTEITRRAGVSRSSFFNYFAGKADILWYVLDERIATVLGGVADPETALPDALSALATTPTPGTLALAIVDARTMGVEAELFAGRADRQLRLAGAIAERLVRDGGDPLRAEIAGAGAAAAALGAVWRWAERGAGRTSLAAALDEALAAAGELLG
ncbi:TetR/AcrR family transcriptional regulator [Leucobacter sp. PH1c]|uniref:TetR/AcrR family transcriptional regulator n=1 Tax=Leucobacter sp. PH1c TaxID=1397278 RepID=UPI0004692A45|nr:TetR/AcrR family transcriptional regulator [Leucobacter sp. PH1c]